MAAELDYRISKSESAEEDSAVSLFQ